MGIQLTIPLRNRVAQARRCDRNSNTGKRSLRIQQIENQIRIEVRNAQFGVQQNRASVASAQAAVDLAKQSLDAEQKKYTLGASTSTLVLQYQSGMTGAEVTLVSAKAAYEKAQVELTAQLAFCSIMPTSRLRMRSAAKSRKSENSLRGPASTDQALPSNSPQPPQ